MYEDECELGSMKVKAKIEWMKTVAVPALSAQQLNPSTNHLAFKKQLSSMLMSSDNLDDVDFVDPDKCLS